jgi:hypothetical protein
MMIVEDRIMHKTLVISALFVLAGAIPAMASDDEKQPDWIMDTSGVGKSHNGVVRSDQILELGVTNPSALQLEGENSMRMGNIDTALTALQKAVEMAPLDMDKRTLYSEALEKKLDGQKEKDPKLYNFLVKQWLFIYRKADFVDQTLAARAHLIGLTGSVPKTFERTATYLARVLIPEDGSTRVSTSKKPAPRPNGAL